jgi:Arabinofuranosyltransferase N terminal
MLRKFGRFERDTIIDRVVNDMKRNAAKQLRKGGHRPFGSTVCGPWTKAQALTLNHASAQASTASPCLGLRANRTGSGGAWRFTALRSVPLGTSNSDTGKGRADLADERGWRELAGDLPLGVTVAALVSVGLQVVVDRLRIPLATNVPLVLLALTAAALATMVVLLVRRSTATIRPLCWVALSALGTLPSALLLHGSRFYFNGIAGDQSFRTQYMTRFAQSPVLTDINYADLPPFYPAGWFWVGGRIAAVLGIPGWVAYKPFALMTMAVAPVIAFSLWGLVVRHRVAFAHAVLTCLVGAGVAYLAARHRRCAPRTGTADHNGRLSGP